MMWYRAAQYDTKAECMEFNERLKKALDQRRDKKDNLLTIAFETPAGKKYAAAIGFPTEETIKFAESLFEKPPATLSREDIHFMQAEVRELRRGAGISDQWASEYARQRLEEAGAPKEFIQNTVEDYLSDESPTIPGQVAKVEALGDNPPNLPPGTPVKIQTIPFIKGYQSLSEARQQQHVQTALQANYPGAYVAEAIDSGVGVDTITNTIQRINRAKLKAADKYLFTPSAMAVHNAVFRRGQHDWIDQTRHVWIEVQEPFKTPYGDNVKAVYLYRSFPLEEIVYITPPKQYPTLYRGMIHTYAGQERQWSLGVIDMRCNDLYDFTFDLDASRWVYLASHQCPYGECSYPIPADMEAGTLGVCTPCPRCQAACDYWASWLYAALCIIRRDYATSPTPDESPFPLAQQHYTETEYKRVGKGKNTRKIKQDVTHAIDYKLVTFDISTRPAPRQKSEHETPAGEKRDNWLTLHGREDLIYKRVVFEGIERRYTQHKHLLDKCVAAGGSFKELDGDIEREYRLETQSDGTVVVVSKLVTFPKYVPMLNPEKRKTQVIKKVVARKETQP